MIWPSYQPFIKGQKVWLEGQNLSLSYNKKITAKREGPFKITEVLGPVNYHLKLPDKWKQHNTFHTSLLILYKENTIHGPNYIQLPADLVEGQQEWEVEWIIKHRKVCTCKGTWQTKFQVQWKGYEDLTWEPEDHLDHAPDLIHNYWARQSKQIAVLTMKDISHKGTMVPAYTPSISAKWIKCMWSMFWTLSTQAPLSKCPTPSIHQRLSDVQWKHIISKHAIPRDNNTTL